MPDQLIFPDCSWPIQRKSQRSRAEGIQLVHLLWKPIQNFSSEGCDGGSKCNHLPSEPCDSPQDIHRIGSLPAKLKETISSESVSDRIFFYTVVAIEAIGFVLLFWKISHGGPPKFWTDALRFPFFPNLLPIIPSIKLKRKTIINKMGQISCNFISMTKVLTWAN